MKIRRFCLSMVLSLSIGLGVLASGCGDDDEEGCEAACNKLTDCGGTYPGNCVDDCTGDSNSEKVCILDCDTNASCLTYANCVLDCE